MEAKPREADESAKRQFMNAGVSLAQFIVRQKLEQVKPSDSLGLPAYIVVVEFSTPLSKVVKK